MWAFQPLGFLLNIKKHISFRVYGSISMPIACLFLNELPMSLESSKLADDFGELHVGDIYGLYLLKICHARGWSPQVEELVCFQ